MLVLRGILAGLMKLAIIAALLIVPAGIAAGAWDWPRGWQFILVYGIAQMCSIVFLALKASQSLEARLRPPVSADQSASDKAATAAIILSMTALFVCIPLDVFVWQLFGKPPAVVSGIGGLMAGAGYWLVMWTVYTNKFAIPIVEDQSGADQVVIENGPYSIVRHPMYLGLILFLAGMGLWLQSWLSLPLTGVVLAALSVRIRIEERTLLETLSGYEEYCQRRTYRILPGLW